MVEETRGVAILNFLRIAVTELKTELKDLWEKVIPRLLQTLTGNEDDEVKKFDSSNWQDLLLKVSRPSWSFMIVLSSTLL